VKQLFKIENPLDRIQAVLSVMISDRHINFSITNKEGDQLYKLLYCTVEEWTEDELDNFFDDNKELEEAYYQVLISYNFRQSMLVPAASYRKSEGGLLLAELKGVPGGSSIVSEAIAEWQIYNVYTVPDIIHNRMKKAFPRATFRHQRSLELRNSGAAVSPGMMLVDFTTEEFSVLFVSQSNLLFSGSFDYAVPADVIYYLLKLCHHFSVDASAVQLQFSGLIVNDSSMYKEIYQYFKNTSFRQADWKTGSEYPAHFFTSINDLSKCAS
jgi:hypothetical protein